VILDEPTSSLDPLAEAELFHQFRHLIQGKSAIIISHRFSTVEMADEIFVLESGKITEHGSHQELIQLGGEYARFYEAQAQFYK
jgi:ABC-type multidrug transport system fused ATPase/permease subunit